MSIPVHVVHADIPAQTRIVAVSDIHGHATYLQHLLEKVRFGPEDALVIVGDVLERGPENLQALRLVMDLCRRYTVYPLLGNVDEWVMDKVLWLDARGLMEDVRQFMDWRGGSLVGDMCEEMGVTLSEDMDIEAFRARVRAEFAEEYAFVHGLATVLETPGYRFVHGGMPPVALDALAGEEARTLTKRDAFMDEAACFDKYVVVGHWPVCLYAGKYTPHTQFAPVVNEAQRIIAIDGGLGVKVEGQLNALLLQHGEIAWESYDELPVRTALDAQAASEESYAITYMDGMVDIIARGDGVALVAHKPSGYRMWVPQERILQEEPDARCNDITDYRLPVAVGDRLTILFETPIGTVCRKDGVEGWYLGRLA